MPEEVNNINSPTPQTPPVTTQKEEKKRDKKKVLIAVFSVIFLVGAIIAGVILVKRQQELRELASSAAECTQAPDCVVFEDPGDEGFREVDRYIDYLMITHKPGEEVRFEQGENDNGCYRVEITENRFRWERYEDSNTCREISNIQVWLGNPPEPTATPTPTPTTPLPASCNDTCTTSSDCQEGLECIGEVCRNPSCSEVESCVCPAPTATPTEVPEDITAVCNQVKVYDISWNLLSSSQLEELEPGNTVRFAVSGTVSEGTIERARFIINGSTTQEVTNKRPGTEEFYIEYDIPEGQLDFNVNGELYHSILGWF